MIEISQVKYEDFKELVKFLQFNEPNSEYHKITKRLTHFIKDMNAIQSVFIDNIVNNILTESPEAENSFNVFKQTYPYLEVDPNGKLESEPFQYYQIALHSINMVYEEAKSHLENKTLRQVDQQVLDARSLEPLIKMEGQFEYPIRKCIYFKKPNRPITVDQMKNAEEEIKQILGKENNIMGKFLNYIYYKKSEKISLFIDHFLYRLDITAKDEKLVYEEDKIFVENLKKIS